MPQNGCMLGRRRFMVMCGGTPWILRRHATAQSDRSGRELQLDYVLADPPPLPPALEYESPARLVIAFRGSGAKAQCVAALRVVLDDEPGLLPLALWTADSHAYWRAREAWRLPAFRGEVSLEGDRSALAVAGRQLFSVTPGPRMGEAPETRPGLSWITYRSTLTPDWTQGPYGKDRPEVWRLRFQTAIQAMDLDPVRCTTGGDLDGWLSRLGAIGPVAAISCGSAPEPEEEFVREIEAAELEPFAFRGHRAGTLGLVPRNGLLVSAKTLEAYRRREEVYQTGLVIVAIDSFAGQAEAQALLPPPCDSLPTPSVRVLAIRGLNNPRLDEAWLLVECVLAGERVWYAASHLRADLEGSAFGREVFGYPTISGSVSAVVGGNRFAATVSRGGRSLYQGAGTYGGFSTGTSLGGMKVATLRLRPRSSERPPRGELVVQPWYYQGLLKPAHSASLSVLFPSADGKPSLWSGIGSVRPYKATVFDGAAMQRLPGSIVSEVADVGPFYRQRCEGRLPWESRPANGRDGASD